MNDLILESVKKLLNIAPTDDAFDIDIVMNINAAFSVLGQLGVGDGSFMLEPSNYNELTWADFEDDPAVANLVKMYVYLKVKQVFDPPTSGAGSEALKALINQYEWRLNLYVDPTRTGNGIENDEEDDDV